MTTTTKTRTRYTSENIKQLISEHGGIYLSGEVTHKESRVRLICPGCHREVEKAAHDVRRRPDSCTLCRHDRASKTVLTENDNLARAQKLARERGGQCLTVDTLVKATDHLMWQCSLGHQWTSSLLSVDSQGTWCPRCKSSQSENFVRALLEESFQLPFLRVRPDFLEGLELDCFNEALGLAIEVDGIQHFKQNAQFHRSTADLDKQQANDRKKRELCKEAGIILINVPYFIIDEGNEGIRSYLDKWLTNKGFNPERNIHTVEIDPRSIYDMQLDQNYQAFETAVKENHGSFDHKNYLGVSRKITVTCKEGHQWSALPHVVMSGHWCPTCAGNSKLNVDTIQQHLKEQGWSLQNPEKLDYQNAHQRLPMVCSCGQKVERSWNKWQQRRNAAVKEGRKPTCPHCRQQANIKVFVTKMEERGVMIDIKDESDNDTEDEIRGVCLKCGSDHRFKASKWKLLTTLPCCGKKMEHYHPCMAK